MASNGPVDLLMLPWRARILCCLPRRISTWADRTQSSHFEFLSFPFCSPAKIPTAKTRGNTYLSTTWDSKSPESLSILEGRGSQSHGTMGADATTALNEVFILLGIGLAIILLRLYARWEAVGFSRWEADDYLMILVIVSTDHAHLFGLMRESPSDIHDTGSIFCRVGPRVSSRGKLRWTCQQRHDGPTKGRPEPG